MNEFFSLLADKRFMPHGHCYLWMPDLLWANVISDVLITLSYITIPVTLVYFIRKRKDIPFDWMFVAFGVFILACGGTHVMEIVTIWQPYYWLAAFIKVITAMASVITALFLLRLVPLALKIPSPRQLALVNEQLRAAQAELVSTARRAGMAEIATNVLHNVGNVLNSVNVSAQVLRETVRTSKGLGVSRVSQLLAEHGDDLGTFMANDLKGKMLPGYLETLAQALDAERQAMASELAALSASIDHIKDIVATQQAYAGTSSVLEPVQVHALMADVVRICDVSLARHKIELVESFEAVPDTLLDKHKVLQVLVNLINNAKQALEPVSGRGPRIDLGVRQGRDGFLHIEVADNGEGIAPEHMARLFEHGFTTRASGHGFGLHSCILAAQQMGGNLSAHSDGPGQGARFVLSLPSQPTPG